MKGFAVLLCVLSAAQVQGRSFESSEGTVDVPWLINLRFSRLSLRGYLDSCVGTLLNDRWVLTAASCLTKIYYGAPASSPFFWIRYDSYNITTPGFVTETSHSRVHPDYIEETGENNIGLIDLNRHIDLTDRIQPLALSESDDEIPSDAIACGYGAVDENPGEIAFCVDLAVTEEDGLLLAQTDIDATKYDLGAALVADDKVYGILVGAANEAASGTFLPIAKYLPWIKEVAGLDDSDEESSGYEAEEILIGKPRY